MKTCRSCSAPLHAENANFCARCGAAVTPGAGEAVPMSAAATGTPAPSAAPKTSPMAIGGFILSLIPCLLNIVGVVLGAIAMSQINKRPRELKGHGLALAAVIIGALWLVATPVFGMLAAIAIPNFLKFQARAKQAEATSSLTAIHAAIGAYEQENDRLPASFQEMGFVPGEPWRYSYFYGADELHPDVGGPYELPEDIPEGAQAAAVANIDGDATLDVWFLDATGTLTNAVNDAME